MRRALLGCALVLCLFAAVAVAGQMTGYITCSKCKHTAAKDLSCAKNCINGGVDAMFYDSAGKKLYTVTNQDAVKSHAGERVVVTGNVSGDSLTVDTVKPAGGGKKKSD